MKQAKITLDKKFHMLTEEISEIDMLPDNMPDTNFTSKQKQFIDDMYYKYIIKNGVSYGWGTDIIELEMKENWPSGSKVKKVNAQLMILGWLKVYNQYNKEIKGNEVANFLMQQLRTREANQVLILKCYNVN